MRELDYRKIAFRHVAIAHNQIWFCNQYYSALFKLDIKEQKIYFESGLPCCNSMGANQFAALAWNNGKLIIAPQNAMSVLIYNPKYREIKSIPLDMERYAKGKKCNYFFDAVSYKNKVFLFPGTFEAIVQVDVISEEITYITEWFSSIKNYIQDHKKIIFSIGNYQVEEKIYLPFWQGNVVMIFDMVSLQCSFHKMKCEDFEFSSIIVKDENWWISAKNRNEIIQYNAIENNVRLIQMNLLEGDIHSDNYVMLDIDDKLYLIPRNGNIIISYNIKTGELIRETEITMRCGLEQLEYVYEHINYICCEKKGNWIVAYSNYTASIEIINLNTKEKMSIPAYLTEDMDLRSIIKENQNIKNYNLRSMRCENGEINLRNFLRLLGVSDEKNRG